MSHTIKYPLVRSRIRLKSTVRKVFCLYDYADGDAQRFCPHIKARDRWKRILWFDFDGIGRARRSSGWKSHKAKKQWEHRAKMQAARDQKRARKALRSPEGFLP